MFPKKSKINLGSIAFKSGIVLIKAGSSTNSLFLFTALTIFFASFSVVNIGINVGSFTPSNIPVLTYAGDTIVIPTCLCPSLINSILNDSEKLDTAALLDAQLAPPGKAVNPDAINIDYSIDPKKIIKEIKIPVQGGLDPKILLNDKQTLKKEAKRYLDIFKDHPYIFNLGHGILPETKIEMVEELVKTVREF